MVSAPCARARASSAPRGRAVEGGQRGQPAEVHGAGALDGAPVRTSVDRERACWRRARATPGGCRRGGSAASCRTSARRSGAAALMRRRPACRSACTRKSPARSSPIAPSATTRAPSRARSTAVPPAVPAGVRRISSRNRLRWPTGSSDTGRPSTSTMYGAERRRPSGATHAARRASAGSITWASPRGRSATPSIWSTTAPSSRRGEDPRAARAHRVVVDRGHPLQLEGEGDGVLDVAAGDDRAVVGHQRGAAVLQRRADRGGQRRRCRTSRSARPGPGRRTPRWRSGSRAARRRGCSSTVA